jgi:hypothetical protein
MGLFLKLVSAPGLSALPTNQNAKISSLTKDPLWDEVGLSGSKSPKTRFRLVSDGALIINEKISTVRDAMRNDRRGERWRKFRTLVGTVEQEESFASVICSLSWFFWSGQPGAPRGELLGPAQYYAGYIWPEIAHLQDCWRPGERVYQVVARGRQMFLVPVVASLDLPFTGSAAISLLR